MNSDEVRLGQTYNMTDMTMTIYRAGCCYALRPSLRVAGHASVVLCDFLHDPSVLVQSRSQLVSA